MLNELCDDYVAKGFEHLAPTSVFVYAGLIKQVIRPRLGSIEGSTVTSADIVSMIETCRFFPT